MFNDACISMIEEVVARLQIGLPIFDPFVALHRIPENDNTNIEAVVGRLAEIANRRRIAIDVDHHIRKQAHGGNREITIADARGAGALINKARTARVLNRMTPAQAQKAKVGDHREYIRVDNGKANYAPAFAATWFKIKSIKLPNGDNVGALEAWKYPSDVEITPEQVEASAPSLAAATSIGLTHNRPIGSAARSPMCSNSMPTTMPTRRRSKKRSRHWLTTARSQRCPVKTKAAVNAFSWLPIHRPTRKAIYWTKTRASPRSRPC